MKKNVKMSSPWVIYANKVNALFAGDDDVKVVLDDDNMKLTLYVTGLMGKKAEAIKELLPTEVEMGNVTLTIEVIPGDEVISYEDYVKAAFYGNENFVGIESQSHGIFGSTTYALFKNGTEQFYCDDLTQYNGNNTMVIADIAKEIINPDSGFYFSTK